jgi:hypothetical protein
MSRMGFRTEMAQSLFGRRSRSRLLVCRALSQAPVNGAQFSHMSQSLYKVSS